MSPITHLLVSWLVASATPLDRRDRALVTLAGVVPDVDGLGAVAEILTRDAERPLDWWSRYHHVLCHNVGFALAVGFLAWILSSRRAVATSLALVALHLHLLGDIVGARGPDGYQWPIPYLLPFSDRGELTWSGQWALNAWPNFVITGVALAATFHLAWRRGRSPVELISRRADGLFVETLRHRFGPPAA
ncbi:MAG TPA: metal-dependent hydrolase [Verrucomicrobiae bacterium]|nr:metal-dependent hydrolase [Verrucomicrobiae bacterium]